MSETKLPKGWAFPQLRELGPRIGGGTPSRTKSSYFKGTIPWITVADLPEAGGTPIFISSARERITEEAIRDSSANILPIGSVVFATRVSLGKSGIAATPIATNQDFRSLLPGEAHEPLFIAQFFSHIVKNGLPSHRGTTIKGIPADTFDSIKVPLPPVSEQRRIVKRLEALQSRSKRAREALESVPALIEKFRQSVLAAAFRGDLTKEWREKNKDKIEPASELLKRSRVERRKKWEEEQLEKFQAAGKLPKDDSWKNKYKEPEVVDSERLPGLPAGWCWASVETVAFVTKLAGFEYTDFVRYRDDGDLPVIKAENVGKFGFKPTEYSKVNSAEVKELTRSFITGGDLLMVFVGAGIGQVARVPEDQRYFLGPNVGLIRVESLMADSEFIEHFLRSPKGVELISLFSKAVAQPSLSMGSIRKIPIPIVPHREQVEIKREIVKILSQIEVLSDFCQETFSNICSLDQAILSKAFRGELVPQDPNDEPASNLLERIMRGSEQNAPATRHTKSKVRRSKSVEA